METGNRVGVERAGRRRDQDDGSFRDRQREQTAKGTELTARQAEVLSVVRDYVRLHGCVPTLRELMDTLQVRSTCTVARLLDTLCRKGCLKEARAQACRGYWPVDVPTYAELLTEVEALRSQFGSTGR